MPQPDDAPNAETTAEMVGVPMGGVGAGCIEMGHDGRFRNITINNNRTSSTRIPRSPGELLAVRVSRRGKTFTRVLQSSSDIPFEEAGISPGFTPEEQLTWRGLYPTARYALNDPKFPIEVRWRAFSPIIPYDIDASTLPVLYLTVELGNPTDDVLDASILFNWENLNGCTRDSFPEARGHIEPIPLTLALPPDKALKDDDSDAAQQLKRSYIGFEFGSPSDVLSNADGHYCLVIKPESHIEVSLASWNERDPAQVNELWRCFRDEGFLGNAFNESEDAHSGAICCSMGLNPKSRRQVIFVLTWFCPRFEVGGVDYGNGYTNQYRDASEVAVRALKYYGYYAGAVESWQKRFLSSTLPAWFNRMLINNNYVFSTNTVLAKDGRFAMMESTDDPVMGALDRRFHSSLGTLLFFPEFEHRELAQFSKAQNPESPGRINRYLGELDLNSPSYGGTPDELIDINPKFVLMAYRNYHMTGRRAALEQLYPRLKQAMEYMLTKDHDKDGLPEQHGISTTFDHHPIHGVNSYTSSLWIAALRAYSRIAQRLGHKDEARHYEEMYARAVQRFEQCLWIQDKGYYRLYCDVESSRHKRDEAREDGCHSGQLAGQWFSDFLCLGHVFPPDHVQLAIDAMWQLNEVPYREKKRQAAELRRLGRTPVDTPSRSELSWPAFYVTHCACLHVTHGNAGRGLYCVQRIYEDIHTQAGRTFNQPLAWDTGLNRPADGGRDRHMGSPSIWHMLYALEGFYLDIPDQTVWVRPSLPTGISRLSAPLFTPSCLGWLDFEEDQGPSYQQRVRIAFDSPIRIKAMVLRIPAGVRDVQIEFISPAGTETTEHMHGYDGNEHLIEIQPSHPVLINGPLTVYLQQIV